MKQGTQLPKRFFLFCFLYASHYHARFDTSQLEGKRTACCFATTRLIYYWKDLLVACLLLTPPPPTTAHTASTKIFYIISVCFLQIMCKLTKKANSPFSLANFPLRYILFVQIFMPHVRYEVDWKGLCGVVYGMHHRIKQRHYSLRTLQYGTHLALFNCRSTKYSNHSNFYLKFLFHTCFLNLHDPCGKTGGLFLLT